MPRARLSPGIQRALEVRLSPEPAEAPARGAREKGKASLVSPGVQSEVGRCILGAWTPPRHAPTTLK